MTAPIKKILQNTRNQRFLLLEIPEENRKFVAPRLLSTESFSSEDCSIKLAFGRYFFADINEGHIPFLLNHYEGTRSGQIESHAFNADLLVILEAESSEKLDSVQKDWLEPIKEEITILKTVELESTDFLKDWSDKKINSSALLDEEEGFFNGGSYLFWQTLNFNSTYSKEDHREEYGFVPMQITEEKSLHTLLFSSTSLNIEDYLDQQFGVRNSEASIILKQSESNFGAFFFLPSEETLKEIQL